MRRQATNAARSPGKEITSQHPQATSRAHSNKSNGTNGTNGAKASKLEFWISEGADEIFRRTPDIATALGPAIAAPVKPVVKLPFDEVMHVVDAVEKLVSDIFSTNIGEDGQLKVLKVMHKDMTERFLESAFDSEPESLFDELTNRTSPCDRFLSSQMARPVTKLKQEGFFDNVCDFLSNGKNLQAVEAGISSVGAVAPVIPVVGSVLDLNSCVLETSLPWSA
ncbi:hypothetical protein GGS26DRAFT_597915 [Hypomontagnella submonticulosa]|nr:hypothetical protein GGS26DRAFT_597915 [Hypomontagnella submonticulosa]